MIKQDLQPHELKTQHLLNEQIRALLLELDEINRQTNVFEDLLRTHLSEVIIEEIELYTLYKSQKNAKKQKRQSRKKAGQKVKGKNYRIPDGLTHPINKIDAKIVNSQDEKIRKDLYREAILLVHPDKFSMQEDDADIAHGITIRLIDLYKNGTITELAAFHAKILNGNVFSDNPTDGSKMLNKAASLEIEKEQLEMALLKAKNKSSYQVLITLQNPMDYIEALKNYYSDRISKLKKRTRTH